jgi:hypothetical protein
MLYKKRDVLLKKAEHKLDKNSPMQAYQLKILLENYGCTTLTSNEQTMRKRLKVAMELYSKVLTYSDGRRIPCDDWREAISELKARDSSEDQQVTCGQFKDYFPCHDQAELDWLKQNWGNYGMLVGALTKCCQKSESNRLRLGCGLKKGAVTRQHMLYYQPIDEVRDYFGDHVALYFAWLGLYTRWLQWPAILGLMTFLYGRFGQVTSEPEANWLAVAYSFFLALWSSLFLDAWNRLETVLRFQWGSEGFESIEQPRARFKGKIEVVDLTGQEKLVHASEAKRICKLTMSWLVGTLMICIVVSGAYWAYKVRDIGPTMWGPKAEDYTDDFSGGSGSASSEFEEDYIASKKQWKIVSSLCSLVNIQFWSQVYKRSSRSLTAWENHRTATQADDSLIVKNFMFEFINNYFTLVRHTPEFSRSLLKNEPV